MRSLIRLQMKKEILLFLCLIFALASGISASAADNYPTKTIQLVCPYAVGGVTDLSARLLAEKMGEILKQPVIVENKPGAGAALGTGYVAGSKPDGYTILTAWTGVSVLVPLITPNLPYKMSSLTPIAKTVTLDMVMLVNKDIPANNLTEFIAYAKQNPKKLSYSTAGVGTLPHLVAEQFNQIAGTDLQHIPYNSELQAVTALVGKHVDATVISYTIAAPHIKTGAIKPIALLAEKRDPDMPNTPTAIEQGYPTLTAAIYNIIYAPAKTPPDVLKKLEDAVERTLKDKDVRDKLAKMDYKVTFLNSRDAQAFLESETKKWAPIVKKANIVIK